MSKLQRITARRCGKFALAMWHAWPGRFARLLPRRFVCLPGVRRCVAALWPCAAVAGAVAPAVV
eukprot:12881463-Alexandrium_andersonii.AAC.1